jgi:hypothetical protein
MPDKTDEKQGKFKKGRSGNPLGRPRGIRNKATIAAEALFKGEIEEICRKAIEQAKCGNIQAIKLVLDRILLAMMEVLFKAKEGDRDQQIKKLQTEVEQHKQNILKFDQQRFISGELEADSYQRLKTHTLGELDRLNLQISDLEISDTAFQKYARYGMSLLKDLTWYFQEAGLEAKRKLLGSIFPAKLTFQDGKISNRSPKSSFSNYPSENQELRKREKWRHRHF